MNPKTQIKPNIIIVDDHLIFQESLKTMISTENLAAVIGVANNGEDFLELLTTIQPDIVLMDIDMPKMNGMEATQKAIKLFPDLKIIALTMFSDEEYYYKMVDLGVKGFLLKSTGIAELEKAIHHVMMGESYFSNEILQKIIRNLSKKTQPKIPTIKELSAREIQILQQICLGNTTDEIAKNLNISPKTVKAHRANLLDKSDCKNTPSLILYALRNNIIEL